MLGLLNRDRATQGLGPLQFDAQASVPAQAHAEEMVAYGYGAHWDIAGKKPVQRINEAGIPDYVVENVYVEWSGSTQPPVEPPLAAPTFTTEELDKMEGAFFNETAPNDGHRRNILNLQRTHVGIGLSRSVHTISCDQELISRYGSITKLPLVAGGGATVHLSGEVPTGYHLYAVGVGWEPAPHPMTREELLQTASYSTPTPYVSYYPPPYQSAIPITVSGQSFSLDVPLSNPAAPDGGLGNYYVYVWVQSVGEAFIASAQVVEVENLPAASGDANGDGAVDVRDVILLLKSVAGLATLTPQQAAAGDVSGDGVVTIKDVVILLRRVAGLP
jgi:hypothetical protein